MKKQHDCKVISNNLIADNIYKMIVEFDEDIGEIKSGQFLNISTGNSENILKRPFGIVENTKNTVTFCYQIKGKGTEYLKNAVKDTKLSCLLPLGNGFEIPQSVKKIALIGGGVGIFPLISIIKKHSDKDITAYFGFRNKCCVCLEEDLKNINKVICTDDGSYLAKGNAVQTFINDKKEFDAIYACGPKVMLNALKEALKLNNIKTKTYVSLEERMGCGIGACLVCTCKKSDGNNARVCKDGPVFDIWEVEI